MRKNLNNPKNGVWGNKAELVIFEGYLFKNGLAWEAGANPIKYSGGNYSINVNDPGPKRVSSTSARSSLTA